MCAIQMEKEKLGKKKQLKITKSYSQKQKQKQIFDGGNINKFLS